MKLSEIIRDTDATILHGNAVPTASNLMPHCDSERINNTSSRKIGFSR